MNYVTSKTFKMKFTIFILAGTFVSCYGDQTSESDTYLSRLIADLWLEGTDVVRIIWRDCTKKFVDVKDIIDHKEYYPKFVRCMKRKTLKALDRSLSMDVVPIADGVNLVRFELVDNSGNIVQENETSPWSDKELEESDWRNLALKRMAKVFRTHVIKFDIEDELINKVEYRGRRRYHMMTMMMFGVVSIGMVLIPMGFQFLAVLGGKALLLAKMSLILASIQGLKKVDSYDGYHERGKIAASPLSYGFYHSYPPYDHYEKRSRGDLQSSRIPEHNLMKKALNQADSFQDNHNTETNGVINTAEQGSIIDENNKENTRQYPIYTGFTSPVKFDSLDSPQHLVDFTTRPGEVQVDYSIDLPYNGFHFQSPTPVVSA